MSSKNYLVIPDLQIPFHHPDSIPFLKRLKKEFKTTETICVGDELDHYWLSTYLKDPECEFGPMGEFNESMRYLKQLYKEFPKMKIATSNHGVRSMKRVIEAGVPKVFLRKYRDVIDAPRGWKWQRVWRFTGKHPFIMQHGDGYSGVGGHRNAAIANHCSTVIGHIHSHAGVAHIKTDGGLIWGMNTGCLVDNDAIAFKYGRHAKFKPVLGAGVILDGGKTPLFIPY